MRRRCCCTTPCNCATMGPHANWTYTRVGPSGPFDPGIFDFHFIVSGSDGGCGAVVAWEWKIGPTVLSTQENPTNILLPGQGPWTVTLTVTDTSGCTATKSQLLHDCTGLPRHVLVTIGGMPNLVVGIKTQAGGDNPTAWVRVCDGGQNYAPWTYCHQPGNFLNPLGSDYAQFARGLCDRLQGTWELPFISQAPNGSFSYGLSGIVIPQNQGPLGSCPASPTQTNPRGISCNFSSCVANDHPTTINNYVVDVSAFNIMSWVSLVSLPPGVTPLDMGTFSPIVQNLNAGDVACVRRRLGIEANGENPCLPYGPVLEYPSCTVVCNG